MDWLELLPISSTGTLSPLLVLSVILVAGGIGGSIARLLGIPGLTGNILAGVVLGMTLFHDLHIATLLQPLSAFAMGLIAVSVGSHLSYRRVRTALRRIVVIAALESVFAFALVVTAARAFDASWTVSLLLGSIAIATAPATTFAIVRETRSKGTLVKTLLTVVALDNIACIIVFAFVQTAVAEFHSDGAMSAEDLGTSIKEAAALCAYALGGCAILGITMGKVVEVLVKNPRFHNFSTVFVAILVTSGLSTWLHLNPLLSCLFLGAFMGNSTAEVEEQLDVLEPLEPLLYVCFFTLAGAALHIESLREAGILVAVYLLARAIGKGVGAGTGGLLAGTTRRIGTSISMGLVPQAGVAIGLVVLLEGDNRIPGEISTLIGAVVLAAVTINEIVGPFFTRAGLKRSGETGRDRPRLVEFLEEEFILVDMKATTKWGALDELTNFFMRAHRVDPARHDQILNSILEREKEVSTAIGQGAAIPHGRVETGPGIEGVLGISREGVDFDAPDGEPVKIFMLIVTPKEHEARHLEVMAALATMISNEVIRTRLTAAIDANDAWEVIEEQGARDFNYFLETDEEPVTAASSAKG